MTEQEWLELFDHNKDKFKWFFDDYFKPEVWNNLITARESGKWLLMMNIMNDVWFYLPDGRFNIMTNPKGWDQFLALLECPPEHENSIDPHESLNHEDLEGMNEIHDEELPF